MKQSARTTRGRSALCRQPRGAVLVVTLAVIVVLTGMAIVLARSTRVEAAAAANVTATAQARAIARGASELVAALPVDLPAEASPVGSGAYWLIRQDYTTGDNDAFAFGLNDETAKLNINFASQAELERLPRMSSAMAAAIIDWRDSDDTPEELGAESDYYLMLDEPYAVKNAPFESVDELLLVRGFTRGALYGEDWNRNGVLDANEDDGDLTPPYDNADGHLDPGLIDLVTVHSLRYVPEEAPVDVNEIGGGGQGGGGQQGGEGQEQPRTIRDVLSQYFEEDRVDTLAGRIASERPHRNLLDLFYKSQMTLEEFAQVADQFTVQNMAEAPININTASRAVLLTLPELSEGEVDALVEYRRSHADTTGEGDDAAQASDNWSPSGPAGGIAWVTEVLEREKAVAIGGHITTTSRQFSADILAVAGDGRGFERMRVIVDATSEPGQRVWLQRLTHLGWPLDPQILADLRAGVPVADMALGSTSTGGFE